MHLTETYRILDEQFQKLNNYSIVCKNNTGFGAGLGGIRDFSHRMFGDCWGHRLRIVGDMLDGFSHRFGGFGGGTLDDF